MLTRHLLLTFALLALPALASAATPDDKPWPSDVPAFVPLEAGEHPRLLFRKADLPALKKKAATPEGQAILKRLRATLDGASGDTLPTLVNAGNKAYDNKGTKKIDDPDAETASGPENSKVVFTISHAAGYGLLYQLTGEKKYADLGREAMQKSLDGIRDRDDRYSFRSPGGALRAGPSLGWTSLGYDLCYDGWDPDFRKTVAEAFSSYHEIDPKTGKPDPNLFIENCILGKRQHPGSNHWGMEVGGSAMAMLAIYNDPGCDMDKFKPLYDASQKIMIRNMTEGFGDGGFFAEGDGAGSMSSHIAFLSALQAWKNAAGKDFVSPRPNAQWMANRWFLQTLSKNAKPDYQPQRGGYPHNIWARDGLSGGGYFSIGFGAATSPDVQSAILWYYKNGGFETADAQNKTPYDTPSPYPHHSILAFVNWPVGLPEKNPAGIIPNAVHDSKWNFYCWRSGWTGPDDVVISILAKSSKGNMGAKGESTFTINDGGSKSTWGNFKGGFKDGFSPAKNGSTILTTSSDESVALDFSGASGSPALLIATGSAAGKGETLELAGKKITLAFFGKGNPAKPAVTGDSLTIGTQTIKLVDGKLILTK